MQRFDMGFDRIDSFNRSPL